jgi:hypothetical protein
MGLIGKPKQKQKKHGKKKFVRVSNKKAVKNGRAQEKPKAKIAPKKRATVDSEAVKEQRALEEYAADMGAVDGYDDVVNNDIDAQDAIENDLVEASLESDEPFGDLSDDVLGDDDSDYEGSDGNQVDGQ